MHCLGYPAVMFSEHIFRRPKHSPSVSTGENSGSLYDLINPKRKRVLNIVQDVKKYKDFSVRLLKLKVEMSI